MDGLALLAQTGIASEDLEVISRRLPVVMLAGDRDSDHDHIEVANFDGQLELTRHLIADHRLRRLAFIGGPSDSPTARRASADSRLPTSRRGYRFRGSPTRGAI